MASGQSWVRFSVIGLIIFSLPLTSVRSHDDLQSTGQQRGVEGGVIQEFTGRHQGQSDPAVSH